MDGVREDPAVLLGLPALDLATTRAGWSSTCPSTPARRSCSRNGIEDLTNCPTTVPALEGQMRVLLSMATADKS